MPGKSGRFCLSAVRGVAPGYRDFGRAGYEGVVREVGNNGFSWSSTASGTNGFYLNFNSTNLNPSNANNRGHGFQVRCLQHLSTFCGCPPDDGNRNYLRAGLHRSVWRLRLADRVEG